MTTTATRPASDSRTARSMGPAAGALAAQLVLTAGSLVLQVVAARTLGADGLGLFALLFGGIVMATAVSTGLVGDSLTVLDRHEAGVRSALGLLTMIVVVLAAAGLSATAVLSDWLSARESVWLATATAAFMLADLARRLLMAVQRFWTLVLVDTAAIATTLVTITALWLLTDLGVGHLLVGLTIGQATACLVAWHRLPRCERRPVRLRPGSWRTVVGFGGFRAAQQFVRPTTLNLARSLVLVTGGAAAVGALEAARLFVAPAMILIQGLASYLFASYAADRTASLGGLRRRADRAAATMLLATVVVGLVATAAVPVLAEPLLGGSFALSTLAVLGWAAYAASCAAVLPYGSLAAVRGHAAQVLALRVLDSGASLALVAVALLALDGPVAVTPWLLSFGSFAGGLLCRQVLLGRRAAERELPVVSADGEAPE